jgi:hypothetical protein
MRSRFTTVIVPLVAICAAAALALGEAPADAQSKPKFYRDDPIRVDPETQDASRVQRTRVSEAYDVIENSFGGGKGDKSARDTGPRRARNVNTIDEVPDSSWFTNRIGIRPLSIDDIVRGPDRGTGPAGKWTVTGRKSEGVTPGLTIKDETGETYWIKFDPKSNPEMASGAEVISTKFFHAFGYHVPENYIVRFTRDDLSIAPGAMVKDEDGRDQPMRWRDIDAVLDRAAKHGDGAYRVLASRNLPGDPLGPFRYHSTRHDDPNDIFPHEDRRELRGLLVFSAWLNHDEVRSGNTLDTLIRADGRAIVRHHLLDFGSTLGSGSVKAQSRRAGNEFLWEARPTLITMLTLGFYVRPWIKVPYPDVPAVGRIESSYFQPDLWKPDYPNPAFRNARADDRFWASKILAAVSEDAIRAVVGTAKYTDARATTYLVETLLARRRKVLAAWLNGTNPVVDVALSDGGTLTFRNAAEQAGVARPAERYTIEWMRFDNGSGATTAVGGEQTVAQPSAQAPAGLIDASSEFVAARIRAHHADHPAWSTPIAAFFRRAAGGWTLVGLERNP